MAGKIKEREDRRVKYTKKALKDALVSLLKEKPLSKISIKEICAVADINRTTFYSHYTDQYDLMQQIQEELLSGIKEYLAGYDFKGDEAQSQEKMIRVFEYIVENGELCRVLLGEHGDQGLKREILALGQQQRLNEWRNGKPIDPQTEEFLYLFVINGSIGIVQKWLQDGLTRPAIEMAEMVLRLTYYGFSAYL